MDPISLHVRDSNLRRVCALDDFTRATLVPRYNAVGAWLVEGIPLSSRAGQALVPGAGIVAMQGDAVLLSGPLLFPEITWDDNGYVLNASGSDDMLAVYGRLTFPDPTAYPNAVTNKWAIYSDDRGPAPAETVMKEYVDANAGPGALSARRWPGLTIATDLGIGATVSFSARNWNLGDLLAQLAIVGGDLRYNVVQVGTGLEFDVTQAVDRSATARFSPTIGNLEGLKYGKKMATTNWVLVGGGGDDVNRVFIITNNTPSITEWGLILEGFKDQRQTIVVDELLAAGDEELATNGDQIGVQLQPLDTSAVTFGEDYNVGDQVTVIVDGVPIVEVVREAAITIADDVQNVTPVVGTTGYAETSTDEARAVDLLFGRQRQNARRLSLLEVAR